MLAFEPKEAGIMQRPPRSPETPILTGVLIRRIVLVGALLLAGAFGLFEWADRRGYDAAGGAHRRGQRLRRRARSSTCSTAAR